MRRTIKGIHSTCCQIILSLACLLERCEIWIPNSTLGFNPELIQSLPYVCILSFCIYQPSLPAPTRRPIGSGRPIAFKSPLSQTGVGIPKVLPITPIIRSQWKAQKGKTQTCLLHRPGHWSLYLKDYETMMSCITTSLTILY